MVNATLRFECHAARFRLRRRMRDAGRTAMLRVDHHGQREPMQ